jgi:hypothetical protein
MTRLTLLRPLWFCSVLVMIIVSVSLRADMYTVRRQGATLVPERSTTVSMDAEDVVLEAVEYGFAVTATFVMRNHSEQEVASLVAFPIIGSGFSGPLSLSREFKVEMKSGTDDQNPFVPAKVQLRTGAKLKNPTDYFADDPPKSAADYPENIIWDVTWAPRETKIIRVHFQMGEPMVLRGSNDLARGWRLMYIVSTGALWKGPIGRADISIRLPKENSQWTAGPGTRRTWSYSDRATWDGKHTLSWHFENWTPTEEIWLQSVDWLGLPAEQMPYYRFLLPLYEGDKKAYSVEFIDSLVSRDLALAKRHFPEKVEAFDLIPLKIAICDWLLHEFYARRGDPFYVGKESASLKFGDGMIGDDQGNLYSWWQGLFGNYTPRGGWYQPKYGPDGGVKTSSLTQMEQQNVKFLRTYLGKLRQTQPPSRYPIHDPGID